MLKEVLQEESPKKPKSLMMSFKVLQKTKNTNDFSICASAAMRRPGTTQVPPHGCPNIAREASRMDDGLRSSKKVPRGPPNTAREATKTLKMASKTALRRPKRAKFGSERPPRRLPTASDGPSPRTA